MLYYKVNLIEVDDKLETREIATSICVNPTTGDPDEDAKFLASTLKSLIQIKGIKDNYLKGNIREAGREALKEVERRFVNGELRIFTLQSEDRKHITMFMEN